MPVSQGTVLVIDDDQDVRWAMRTLLRDTGFDVAEADAAASGLELAARRTPDAVLLDIRMPDADGNEVLHRLRHLDKAMPVIVVTGFGTIAGAIEAIRAGAFEYITKPFRNERLVNVVCRAVSRHRACSSPATAMTRSAITAVMGQSAAIRNLIDQIEAVIDTDYSVLIRGETGTGKEVVARCLHAKGPRARRPFAVVDCGGIVDSLVNSEFFGHEKGAYTGAASRRVGWFEAAGNGGTLFLDEIGNLTLVGQKALLRVLEERVIHRVGSTSPIRVDLRVVAATNESLEDRIRAGAFREDLFFRLAEYVITLPPLRARREDIEFLAYRFLDEACQLLGRSAIDIAPRALEVLRGYDWPGNVRELRNVVRRVALRSGDTITAAQVAGCLGAATPDASTARRPENGAMLLRERIHEKVREIERGAVYDALERAHGNKAEAARLLGVDYKTYRLKLKALAEAPPVQGHAHP